MTLSQQTKNMRNIILLLLLTLCLIILSYYYLDRQMVLFLANHHSRNWHLLHAMADYIPNAISLFVFLFYFYFGIRTLIANPLIKSKISINDKKRITMCNAIVIGIFLKDSLKIIFGRYWTSTFVCNNPSFLDNHVYGFNWFTNGTAFSSFPSGHTTLVFSFSTSMWFLFPRLRWLWSLIALFVVIGQVGMYYHYISDVIAGALLGSFVALCNYRYTDAFKA